MLIKRVKSQLLRSLGKHLPWNLKISHSQFGEDMVIDHLTRGELPGFYVDIGAYHPIALSNTHALYSRGWRGINIEPRSHMLTEFQAYRPHDVNLSIAVVGRPAPEPLPLYVFNPPEYSTLSPTRADELQRSGHRLSCVAHVPVLTLAQVLERYGPSDGKIDLLNIDAEGFDEDILRGNDWQRFRPRIIAFERHNVALRDITSDPTLVWLELLGYELTAKCGPTLILTHSTKAWLSTDVEGSLQLSGTKG